MGNDAGRSFRTPDVSSGKTRLQQTRVLSIFGFSGEALRTYTQCSHPNGSWSAHIDVTSLSGEMQNEDTDLW